MFTLWQSTVLSFLTVGAVTAQQQDASVLYNPGPVNSCYGVEQDAPCTASKHAQFMSQCGSNPGKASFNVSRYHADAPVSGFSGDGKNPMIVTMANNALANGESASCNTNCDLHETTFEYTYPGFAIKKQDNGNEYNLAEWDQWIVEYDVTLKNDTACTDCDAWTQKCAATGQTYPGNCQLTRSGCSGYTRQYLTTDFIYYWGKTKNLMSVIHYNPVHTDANVGPFQVNDTQADGSKLPGYRLAVNGPPGLVPGQKTRISLDFRALIQKYSAQLCHGGNGAIPSSLSLYSLQVVSSNVNTSSSFDITNASIILRKNPASATSYATPTTTYSTTPSYCPTSVSGSTSCAKLYGQCGGSGFSGSKCCEAGSSCVPQNPYYSQCLSNSRMVVQARASCSALYDQCGGQNWNGPTCCAAGSTCQYQNPYYSQCLASSSSTITPTSTTTTSTSSTTTSQTSTSATPAATPGSRVKYGGINIAGFDFGTDPNNCGSQNPNSVYPPLKDVTGRDGIGQMQHFVTDDGFNAFRLPVTWQWLINGNLNANSINTANFTQYDRLVQGCLNSGAALCILDIHNYARYNGAIIGQGGPTNDQFASLWGQLATKYKSSSKIAYGIMNEPHDSSASQCNNNVNVQTWAGTVQAAVNAIRNAGATSMILMPGNNYDHAITLLPSGDGSGAALLGVSNPSGSGLSAKQNLIFDVHEYLDSNDSGYGSCTRNVKASGDSLAQLASWLRQNGRQAFLSETGGLDKNQDCVNSMKTMISFLNANSDVYLGFTSFAAGSFQDGDPLSETPTNNGGSWTDTSIVAGALKPCYVNGC